MRHLFEDMADWVKILGLALVYLVVAFFMGMRHSPDSQLTTSTTFLSATR